MTSSTSHYVASEPLGETTTQFRPKTTKTALEHLREYARERPEVVALWCIGVGFVLGWKLKRW